MSASASAAVPDNTPIIVGVAQCVEHVNDGAQPPFTSPIDLAGTAAQKALADAGAAADEIDTVAVIRFFADAAKAWASPFGVSNNPPESVARRIGASPRDRIYSNASGAQPLQMLMEMLLDIARGERGMVLLAGAEAIANQRYALRNQLQDDWNEHFDVPLDNREYLRRMASMEEIRSGLLMPAHYYALIENYQAHALGHDGDQHRQHMAQLMAPFSRVAAANPYSHSPNAYTADELAQVNRGNYLISHPLSKLLVAQDAVNQSAALLVTSAGRARQLGIDPSQWIFIEAYAEGEDCYLTQREDVGRSAAMEQVFDATLEMAQAGADSMSLLDIYSCFPCAVHAARCALGISADDCRGLTVTGGLPYFGGPGNNYVTHALAEMAVRLRGSEDRGLITANGGILSKHAAAVLSNQAQRAAAIDWAHYTPITVEPQSIAARPYAAEPHSGSVISYTVIIGRDAPDVGVVLCEDAEGARFLASSSDSAITASMLVGSPIGRTVKVTTAEDRHAFTINQSALHNRRPPALSAAQIRLGGKAAQTR
ncbi:MAG: acetyl-CoA acetyltransferase [Halioglobus sp.]